MVANDVLRRLRFIFDISDSDMMKLSSSDSNSVTRAQVSSWLKKDDDPEQEVCSDQQLALFLNNFISSKRGKRDGPQPEPEKRLSNNAVLKKLKIALNLQSDDMLALLSLANFKLSNHELSAFFRKVGHKHYRECKDQVLRNFLQGLAQKHRADSVSEKATPPPPKTAAPPAGKSYYKKLK